MDAAARAPAHAGAAAQARALWQARTQRERRAAAIAILAVLLLVVWTVAVRPALRTAREAPARIDRLDAELQQMRALAAESRELRAARPVTAAQSAAALQAATAQLGPAGRLTLLGDRATLTLDGVQGTVLAAWLDEARAAARARPVEAQLARSSGGGYSGTLTVALGGTQ